MRLVAFNLIDVIDLMCKTTFFKMAKDAINIRDNSVRARKVNTPTVVRVSVLLSDYRTSYNLSEIFVLHIGLF